MKLGYMIFIALICVSAGFFLGHYKASENSRLVNRIDSLMEVDKKVVKFDSLRTADLNRFLDSLKVLRTALITEKAQRHAQDLILLQKANSIVQRYDNIVVPERPDF